MIPSDSYEAVRNLLRTLLRLEEGNRLLFVFDETSSSFFDLCREAGETLGIAVEGLFIPFQDQLCGAQAQRQAYLEMGHGFEARVIVLANRMETERVRLHFQSDTPGTVSIGTMPGFVEDYVDFLNYDLKEATRICNSLLLPLWKGSEVRIVTSCAGKSYELMVGLEGWKRFPIASTGQIDRGHHGNIPGAESFVAPLEGTAAGELIVDGSIPGHVLSRDRPLRLTFREGRLIDFAGPHAAEGYLRRLGSVERHCLPCWDQLGEIGIGTNRRITRMTGVPLLDEKAYGTAHVALGRNAGFGGTLEGGPHTDIVFRPVEISVDDKTVLSSGELVLRDDDWLEDPSDHDGFPLDDRMEVLEAKGLWQFGSEGEILRLSWDERGRRTFIRIGNKRATPYLEAILRCLRERDEAVAVSTLNRLLGADRGLISASIRILERAQVVTLSNCAHQAVL